MTESSSSSASFSQPPNPPHEIPGVAANDQTPHGVLQPGCDDWMREYIILPMPYPETGSDLLEFESGNPLLHLGSGSTSTSFPLIRVHEHGSPVLPPPSTFDERPPIISHEQEFIDVFGMLDNDHFNIAEGLLVDDQPAFQLIGPGAIAPEAILEGLEFRRYRSDKLKATEELCSICLDKLVDREHIVKLDCNHHFHFTCIEQWLAQKNQCPICRNVGIPLN